jgi:hypothetical protein
MSTHVSVNTYTHSVTYVTGEMVRSLKQIIRLSGLNSELLMNSWASLETGISTWIRSKHLKKVTLEIYNPYTDALVTRWDFEIIYSYGADDDGSLWADHEAIRNAIDKAGVVAATCKYEFKILAPGGESVSGWSATTYRSTEGFHQHCLGTTIGANSLGSGTSFWKKTT